ncbi:MAG: ATP-dependent helicase [Verrucomicrobia bacterium]|nr:ATP-dependent helicase [Verrucomicrobiota bacterium]
MSREYVLKTFRPAVNLQIDYAKELNPQQHAAVTAPPGPALVIAGAGSGKTRTLTYRVAFLLEQGVPADRILLLTFTNKAAKEMMRRVTELLGSELKDLWGGTFHSVGARILRRHAETLGYKPDFTIMDRDDAEDLLKACIGDADIDVKATRFPKAEALAEVFSMAVNTQQPLGKMVEAQYPWFMPLTAQIEDLARRYAERKRATNNMDFDDLLALWLRLMREHEDTRDRYQRKFQFVLVDEYQDTNKLQADLIDLLAAKHHNVTAVGDDSQSIYAWRGANFRNILEFPKRYAAAKVFKIETNYRSTPEILTVANAAIAPNIHQFRKELAPARKPGPKPIVVACNTGEEQAAFVAQRVLELREEGVALDRMAVLYRSHFHALELQLELTRRNIPFSITSGIRFFEQAHIKDVAAWLKWITNPADELSFKRLAMMLPGVGAKGAAKLWAKFSAEVQSPKSKVQSPLATALQACAAAVPKKAATAWAQFVATVAQLEAPDVRVKPAQMIEWVVEAGYEDYLKDNYDNYRNRLDDLEQLGGFALQFASTEEFLTQLSLLTNLEAEDDKTRPADEERLRLSTVHQAKGLEFDVVFVIMLCDGLFPSARSLETPEGEEEERRLFYVAITRARNELYLSHPIFRAAHGYSGGDTLQQPSRFLKDIAKDLVEEWNLKPFNPYSA